MPELKTEKGLILSARKLGEKSWILSLFTREYGRILGVYSKKKVPDIGAFVSGRWQARLSEQLGNLYIEETEALSARYLDDQKRLWCLMRLCALLDNLLPERQEFARLFHLVDNFLKGLDEENFMAQYVRFEVDLLSEIGFGLDLSGCAGGGNPDDLAYVSPKTGRAVSREKGEPYREKLLTLPAFLWKEVVPTEQDIQAGLKLTAFFLNQHLKKKIVINHYFE